MSIAASKSSIFVSFKSLGALFLFILFGLFLDSFYILEITNHAQLFANISMFIGFTIVFFKVNKRAKELMLYAVLIGVVGEYLFSILLGMYTYRLENIPHYVPLGHALVYVAVLYFSKASSIKKNNKKIELFFTIFIVVYASIFLIYREDVFGFVMTVATLLILRNKPRERLFYLTMYVAVAYLEIIGTHYLCWKWPETAWGAVSFLKSANPPSGISLCYFLLDLGCLWCYKQRHKIAWSRMKNSRILKYSIKSIP
jgi:hypothetical protein